jgi:hypothetical protein
MAFWNLSEDSLWHQKRLDEERQKASVKSHTSALNVGARWLKTNKTTHTAVSSPYYGGDTNHSHSHNHNQNLYSENHAVAASAAGDPGGPPRSPTPSHDGMSVPPTLTSHDTWQQRLAGYDPSNMRKTWHPTWGPTPDSAGHQPLIPKDLLATWRSSKGMGHA